jgi:glycogenin glucosyltransferase
VSGSSAPHAFVTFLMLNDNYLPGALVLAFGLRRQQVTAPIVCLVTEGVSPQARRALEVLFDEVIEVEPVYVPHARRQERQDRPYFFTRMQALRLGSGGGLGCNFERVVVIDADVLPLSNYWRLLELEPPAGVLNERKSHFVETDAGGHYVVPESALKEGRWNWHRIYADCLHGQLVPRHISDRPRHDPENMGFNGSLFVMRPDLLEFEEILRDIERPEMQQLVGDRFDWPDMQYLTLRWSGQWRNIDVRYSALNGYPHLDVCYGTHFAGFKPWYVGRRNSMHRYARFDDFRLWFATYEEMVRRHPALLKLGKLRRLREDVRRLQSPRSEPNPHKSPRTRRK